MLMIAMSLILLRLTGKHIDLHGGGCALYNVEGRVCKKKNSETKNCTLKKYGEKSKKRTLILDYVICDYFYFKSRQHFIFFFLAQVNGDMQILLCTPLNRHSVPPS